MYRFASLSLLCALACGGLMAAPAPFRRASPVWTLGWDKPVGEGRFDRDGDKLTITVSGKNAARLIRVVEGDFVVRVRVSGDFRPTWSGLRRAGLLVTDGTDFFRLDRRDGFLCLTRPIDVADSGPPIKLDLGINFEGPPAERPVFYRLERRGKALQFSWNENGQHWLRLGEPVLPGNRPQKLKVGVFAEATAEGSFRPVFDKFQLSKPTNQGSQRLKPKRP
jgi:regulation of enolase protein 1 (concanavalin A-like superfamily)